MPVIIRSITIRVPRQQVWDVLADVPRQPTWMRDLKSLTLESPKRPVGVGTRAVGTVRMFGISQSDPIEITEFRPPERYAIRHHGRFAGGGTFDLAPLAGGRATRLRWREDLSLDARSLRMSSLVMRLVATGARWMDPLFAPVLTWVFRSDLRRLRRLLESGTLHGHADGTVKAGRTSDAP